MTTKRITFAFHITIFLIEVVLIYMLINSYLTKDLISPNDITFYEYLINKITNVI